MICSKCGSDNVVIKDDVYVKEKGSSIILNIFLSLITGGFWLLWLLIKMICGKSKKSITYNRKVAVCQRCGASFILENKKCK